MIAKLIDFMLMKESPFYKIGESRHDMGNRIVNPKFAALISTVSVMLRHTFTDTWTEDDYKMGIKPHTLLEGKVKQPLNRFLHYRKMTKLQSEAKTSLQKQLKMHMIILL